MKWVRLDSSTDVPKVGLLGGTKNPDSGIINKARSSHSVTAVGDVLFLCGGEHAPRVPLGSEMFAYNLKERCWSKVETSGTPPSSRIAHAAAAIGPNIYLFGGRSGIDMGEGSLNDLHRFDTATASWDAVQPAADSPLPPKRSYHAVTSAGGKLYLFGGCGEAGVGRLNDLWEFDPSRSAWRQLPSSDAIKGRGGAGFAATPDALFVVAGFSGQENNDVHRFDLRTETWSTSEAPAAAPASGAGCSHPEAPVVLPPRSVAAVATHGCSSCSHANHIVCFGGEVDPSSEGHAGAGGYSNDCFCLDTACLHWHRASPAGEAPAPRGWLAATACPAGIVVHGGNGLDNARLDDMWLLEMH